MAKGRSKKNDDKEDESETPFALRYAPQPEYIDVPVVLNSGTEYVVMEYYKISAKGNEIPAGYFLKEKSDGYYQVYNEQKEKHFFSIGPDLLKKLSLKRI